MRLIDADALLERACNLEAQALAYVGKIVNDESKIEEWKKWSAILAERTAFKHDVFDAPTIEPEPQWIPCGERLPEGKQEVLVTEYGDTDIGRRFEGRWLDRYGDKMKDVAAWMPLPEPYER